MEYYSAIKKNTFESSNEVDETGAYIQSEDSGIETCIISYKKRIASPGLMQDTGCLGLVHWDDPEG